MRPIARVGDPVVCVCSCEGCSPCPPGAILTGSHNVLVEGKPIARVGDSCSNCAGCCCPAPNPILLGNHRVLVNGRPIARMGDGVMCGHIIVGAARTLA